MALQNVQKSLSLNSTKKRTQQPNPLWVVFIPIFESVQIPWTWQPPPVNSNDAFIFISICLSVYLFIKYIYQYNLLYINYICIHKYTMFIISAFRCLKALTILQPPFNLNLSNLNYSLLKPFPQEVNSFSIWVRKAFLNTTSLTPIQNE